MTTMMKLVVVVAMIGGCTVDNGSAIPAGETAQATTVADAGTGGGNPGPNVWHSVWNGGSAYANSWGPTSSGYIDAYENKSGQSRYAYLNYYENAVDPTSQTCYSYTDWWGDTYSYCYYTRFSWDYGWGQIPTHDFQVTPSGARVKTTVAAGGTFYAYHCDVDYGSWLWNCYVPTGGTIDVKWGKSGGYSQSQSGTSEHAYGPYTYRTSGTFTSSSAHAQGSILGVSFDAFGSFGDTHQASVTKEIVNTPRP